MEKPLIESSRSNTFQRFSNIMPKSLLTERWIESMNSNMNMSKKKFNFAFGWNSIKEFEHGKEKFWRMKSTQNNNGL
jgi:hypothetical protein